MEKFPNQEAAPSKERVIELIKEQGRSPEAAEILGAWLDAQMALVENNPKGDGSFERAQLALNIEAALIVLEGGLTEEAIEQLYEAFLHARQCGTMKISEEIWAKIQEAEKHLADDQK